jgi:hypothetical protein
MTATQRRAWVWYAVAWLVVGVVYASMMTHSRPMFIGLPTSIAFLEGIGYVVPVAFLGVGVWYFTGWLAWPPRHAWRFVAWHLGAAMIFSWSWLAAQGAWIAVGTGVRAAVLIVGSFAGYAVLDGVFVYGIIAAGSHAVRIASRLREAQARTVRADSLRMRAELERCAADSTRIFSSTPCIRSRRSSGAIPVPPNARSSGSATCCATCSTSSAPTGRT